MIPEWLEARQLGEEAFEAAYAAALPQERALVKTAIATLYTWLDPSDLLWMRSEAEKGQGLCLSTRSSPRNWAVVQIPAHCCDPGLVVGAVLPLLAAGVWPVIAFLEEEDPNRQEAILALELSGVETVYILPSTMMEHALKQWMRGDANGPGIVVSIDPGTILSCGQENNASGGHMLVKLPRPQKAGVWLQEQDIDLWALSFMHPGLDCGVWSEVERELPPGFRSICGQWFDFLQQRLDVVWVPRSLMNQALNTFSLVLGPGQEPVWIWPWYVSSLAGHIRLAVAQGQKPESV